jgi:hypothetical protein
LAFSEYDEWTTTDERQSVEFRNALETRENVDDCYSVYKLLAYDKDVSEFIDWWEMEELLKTEASNWSSYVSFDSNTATLWGDFSRMDIDELSQDRFDNGYIEF